MISDMDFWSGDPCYRSSIDPTEIPEGANGPRGGGFVHDFSSRHLPRDVLLDQCDQLLFIIRLAEVVVGAELFGEVAVLLGDPRGDHDHRQSVPARIGTTG